MHQSSFVFVVTPGGISTLLCAILFLVASPLTAQDTRNHGAGAGFHAELLAGQAGMSGGTHRFGGVNASFSGDRWGGAMHALFGQGNGYGSSLVSAGPTVRFPLHPRADLQVMVGAAYYGESLDSNGRSGSVFGPSGSVVVRVPVGPVHLMAGLTGWYASYTDEIAVNPVPAEGVRFVLGVGR